jgi:hypothetical protein
MHVSAQRKATP